MKNKLIGQLIKKIVVPIDFSPASLNAAIYAAHVAKQKDAEITLVHAYFNPITNPVSYDHFYAFPANVGETLGEIISNAGDLMREFMAKYNSYIVDNKLNTVSIKTEIVGGIAEEAILDFAMEGKFDLMIMGTVQQKGTESYFGSFMTEIIKQSTIPVLAIPADCSYKESMFKKMMYATNFDKSDGQAIRKLIGLSLPLESHIYIVHIDDTDDNPFINYDLAHFKEKYIGTGDGVKMDFDLIVNKNLAKGIESYIVEKEIDIVSVTSHKRNIFSALFQPSLTKELLFKLKIPFLIFHA
ncbi:MAG: universal stress protein [Mariniphaga sp.]